MKKPKLTYWRKYLLAWLILFLTVNTIPSFISYSITILLVMEYINKQFNIIIEKEIED